MSILIQNIGGLKFRYTLDAKAEATTAEKASTLTIDMDVLLDFKCGHQATLLSDSEGDTLLVAVTDSKSGIVQPAHLCSVEQVIGHCLKSIGSREILRAMVPSEGLSDTVIDVGGEVQVERTMWWETRSYNMAKHEDGIWRPKGQPRLKFDCICPDDARQSARRQALYVFRNLVNEHIYKYDVM